MDDPRVSRVMDISTSAIRCALEKSDQVCTTILRLESIDAKHRKDLYHDFLRSSQGMEIEEFIGFLPLQKVNIKDDKFIVECQKHFSNGIPSPGLIFPIFGTYKNGICVSKRSDTVFTVNEEQVEYWILVCAVAYNKKKVKETLIFSEHPEMPHQAMKWDEMIDLKNEPPGYKRHFECIKNILYVGETVGIGSCPRNVLPLAVVKVQFSSKNSNALNNMCIVEPPIQRMNRSNLNLRVNELMCKKGQVVRSVFDKMSVNGISLHSRYPITEEEWPLHLYFDSYVTLPYVFNSWIMKGKLNVEKLLKEGNVQIPSSVFYDHSHKMCSREHPQHVYLNYYEVDPPKVDRNMMIERLVDLDHRGMILFSCVPQISRSGHSLYAGVPPGEVANRLGLPSIARGRFHLIHAMPVPKGTYEMVDRRAELQEIFASDPYLQKRRFNRSCQTTNEVIELSSDEEGTTQEKRREESVLPLPPSDQLLFPSAAVAANQSVDGLNPRRVLPSNPSSIHSSSISRIPTGVPPPFLPPSTTNMGPSPPPPRPHSSTPLHLMIPSVVSRLSMESRQPKENQMQQLPSQHRVIPSQIREEQHDNYDPCEMDVSDDANEDNAVMEKEMMHPPSQHRFIPSQRREGPEDDYDPCAMDVSDDEAENPLTERQKSFENRMESLGISFEDTIGMRDESIENREKEKRKGRRDIEEISLEENYLSDYQKRRVKRMEPTTRECRPSICVDLVDEEEDFDEVCISPDRPKSPVKGGFRILNKSITLNARSALRDTPDKEDTFITLSPDRHKPCTKGGFRTLKKPAAKIALNARSAPRDAPGSEDTLERSEFVVWNRKSKGAENKSFTRLPLSASIIVFDDELFKQLKLNELNGVIKMLNALSDDDQKRLLVVVHDDFDPHKLNGINPSILFIMDHKGETSNDAKVECCDRVRKMGGHGRVDMIYLSPNVRRDLSKNNSLTNLGFKIWDVAGMENQLESSQYEDY